MKYEPFLVGVSMMFVLLDFLGKDPISGAYLFKSVETATEIYLSSIVNTHHHGDHHVRRIVVQLVPIVFIKPKD